MTDKIIIAGAGPAGLTAAMELVKEGCQPLLFEADAQVGGISKTVNYKNNRIDIGGHRFFSKSDWVMQWWQQILPLEKIEQHQQISYQNKTRELPHFNEVIGEQEAVMLLRPRLSRIYFLRKFFDYPLKINLKTITNLGLIKLIKAGFSYLYAKAFPIKQEKSLRDFVINRFGKELYSTFFESYTYKVWGVPCEEISPEWGAQRIKGVSITEVVKHAIAKLLRLQGSKNTSLIEQFLYPKRGPGQLWEEVAASICAQGGEINLQQKVSRVYVENGNISAVAVTDLKTGNETKTACTNFISTMPVKDLINMIEGDLPEAVKTVANGLIYRDFITVGLLLKRFKPSQYTQNDNLNMLPDNWIYIQEPDVRVGRLQIFNNWSPYMVADKNTIWVGLEYFCSEGDDLWSMNNSELASLAAEELNAIGLVENQDVLDSFVLKVPKAYPAYFGTYDQFEIIRSYCDSIEGMYLIGRNGMHRYNNQDHSMLTAKLAAESILEGVDKRAEIWATNIDDDYHEEA